MGDVDRGRGVNWPELISATFVRYTMHKKFSVFAGTEEDTDKCWLAPDESVDA